MPTEKTQHGFTIVELLIASVIIAVGILAWAKTQQGSIRHRDISNCITTASELGMAKLEELALECQEDPAEDTDSDPITTQGVQYDIAWTIRKGELADLDKLDVWKIDVSVSWNHYGSNSLQYQRIVVGN